MGTDKPIHAHVMDESEQERFVTHSSRTRGHGIYMRYSLPTPHACEGRVPEKERLVGHSSHTRANII